MFMHSNYTFFFILAILFSWIEQLISLGIVLPEQTMSALETSLGQKSSVPSSTGERAKRILSTLNQ